MPFRADVLKMGQGQVRGPEVYWMDPWDRWEELYFYVVVVCGEGKVAVVTPGPPRAERASWQGS